MFIELLPEAINPLWFLFALPVAIFGFVGDVANVATGGALKGDLLFKQPKSKPFAVQSETEKAFGGGFEELLLGRETDEAGEFLGPSLLQQSFDPGARDQLFKKAKKRTKKTFAKEKSAALRTFSEDLLPAIRERAGSRGTGVSTGTQIAGVEAAEGLLEDIGTRRSAALGQLDLIRAQAEENLFTQIINAALQQSGTTGVGTPQFGGSAVQQAGTFIGGAAALAGG